jgi:hypothetical protein
MPTILDRALAGVARWHAAGVFRRFNRRLRDVDRTQLRTLARALSALRGSEFSVRNSLDRVRTPAELRRALPLQTYEDLRPFIDRVRDGDSGALFAPGISILMFATSSGTTAARKFVPVTPEFVRQYRRGWNTFGLKMLSDHPRAFLRHILQSSGRYDESVTSSGVPCGAITGLLARTQKPIVRRFYVGRPEIAYLDDPAARYYTLARFGIVHDVAFAVTANPATLIRIAQIASENAEELIRDVRDGTLSPRIVPDAALRKRLSAALRPAPSRASALAALQSQHGSLRPRDYWQLEFAACWTGGSMGHYLPKLREWFGPLPTRDVGLLASEGRVSIPLADNTPAGVLDVEAACFEFICTRDADSPNPATLAPRELEPGSDYVVVLTNDAGLVRYRLDDVVRVHGFVGQAPIIEFLHRSGRVASVAGEKLTENQLVAAIQAACRELHVETPEFLAAPQWADTPFYRINTSIACVEALSVCLERHLCDQNDEYASRRKSGRLGPLQVRHVPQRCFEALDRRLLARGGSPAEQFKRPCLLTAPDGDHDFTCDG